VEEYSDAEAGRLAAALGNLPPTSSLVLETEETNTRKDAAIAAYAEKMEARACHPPFEKEMPGWLEQRARKKGLTMERGTAVFLIERMGRDLAALDGMLEELKTFIHPRANVAIQDAAKLAPSNPEEDVYRLADLILDERKKEALKTLEGLYRSGAEGPVIVGAVAGQIERYRKALSSVAAGRTPLQAAEELRVPRPFQADFARRLSNLTGEKLKRYRKQLLACDTAFKTGAAGERVSIERFILVI
jgi:DNA polymerase III delta subunit